MQTRVHAYLSAFEVLGVDLVPRLVILLVGLTLVMYLGEVDF